MSFYEFAMQFWPHFVSGALSIFAAITGVFAAINAHRFSKYLENAKKRETYTVCPHCKKKILLSELAFHLPSGEVDQDLDGRPD